MELFLTELGLGYLLNRRPDAVLLFGVLFHYLDILIIIAFVYNVHQFRRYGVSRNEPKWSVSVDMFLTLKGLFKEILVVGAIVILLYLATGASFQSNSFLGALFSNLKFAALLGVVSVGLFLFLRHQALKHYEHLSEESIQQKTATFHKYMQIGRGIFVCLALIIFGYNFVFVTMGF